MSLRIGSANQSLAQRYKGRKVFGKHQNLGATLFQNARLGGVDLVDGQAHQCRDLLCRNSLDPQACSNACHVLYSKRGLRARHEVAV
jgi:hypothetical protein